jgi:AmmeMemoRadiSam system protein B/AmmeMemoRadiSam system protein A
MSISTESRGRWFLKWRIALAALWALGCGGGPAGGQDVHRCSGAGFWFERDPKALQVQVDGFLEAATPPEIAGPIRALVVPHAGYQYSGQTAAHAYKLLRGRPIKRVVILAFSHSTPIDGASVLNVEEYQTPLGSIPVDREMVAALLSDWRFETVPAAHHKEHSDENQLPFLQRVLGDFKMVSILVGQIDSSDPGGARRRLRGAAETLRPWLDEETLLVVSSDFTHYGASYGYMPFRGDIETHLKALDGDAASYLLQRDVDGFLGCLRRGADVARGTELTICGRAPLALMVETLGSEGLPGVFLHYGRSGGGDAGFSQSVGYVAMAFPGEEQPEGPATERPDFVAPAGGRPQLTAEEQAILLTLARKAIAANIDPGVRAPNPGDYEITPRLMAAQGAFVTLTIRGRLRGCIGEVVTTAPLYNVVMRKAESAAFGDPRFPSLTPEELARAHIEISALLTPDGQVDGVPTRPLDDVSLIRMGIDGLTISKGGRAGIFLPQVPGQAGWDRQEYLRNLCGKAGLSASDWKDAKIERFTAQVFGEQTNETH